MIKEAVTRAMNLGLPSVVWTFDPPPRVFFSGREIHGSPGIPVLIARGRLDRSEFLETLDA